MSLLRPPALRPGDAIGIVAPASPVRGDLLAAGCREMESLGFEARYDADIEASDRYLAGSLARREAEFRKWMSEPEVRGVFCARGGYGSGHLLPGMDFGAILASPRVFCGSSDITMLLNALEKAGMVVFHGPMVATTLGLGPGAYDRTIFEKLLIRGEAVRFPTGGCRGLVAGEAEGPLTGGCLSLVVSLLGTRWEIDTRDRLLVLEDTHCRPYQIDRMLTQMLQAGKLDGVRGFIFGEMQDCYQNDTEGYTLEDVVVDVLGGLGVPILYDFPTGHSTRPNVVVPFGVPARIRVGSTRADPAGEAPIVFELLEPAVGPR